MENERRGDGKSQGEIQRDARREKESQQARDRVRQVGQRDVERDRWKDREIKRQADRQTQIEGHFWKRNSGCWSYLLWEPGRGQDQGTTQPPIRGLIHPFVPHGLWPSSDLHPHSLKDWEPVQPLTPAHAWHWLTNGL